MQLVVGGGEPDSHREEGWWDSTDGENMSTLRGSRVPVLEKMDHVTTYDHVETASSIRRTQTQERSPSGAVCVDAAGHMPVSPLACDPEQRLSGSSTVFSRVFVKC